MRFGEEDATPAARKLSTRPTSPRVAELGHRLSERFDTRVKVDFGKSKGKIVVEFATIGDLERIVDLMDPAPTQD